MFGKKENTRDRAIIAAGLGASGALLGASAGALLGAASIIPSVYTAIRDLGMTEERYAAATAYLEATAQRRFGDRNAVLLLDEKDVRSNEDAWKLLKLSKSSQLTMARRSNIGSALGMVAGGALAGTIGYTKMSAFKAAGLF